MTEEAIDSILLYINILTSISRISIERKIYLLEREVRAGTNIKYASLESNREIKIKVYVYLEHRLEQEQE